MTRSRRGWRQGLRVASPVQARVPATLRIRTRVLASLQDVEVIWALGQFLGGLFNADLAARSRLGEVPADKLAFSWAQRKQALTRVTSSRWAGAITKEVHRAWRAARAAQARHIEHLDATIHTIRARLGVPVGTTGGYRDGNERAMKQWRLQVLHARLRRVRADHAVGRVHICRGGKGLLRTRHYLLEAALTQTQWEERWQAARVFLHANGEAGKMGGNETIRVIPEDDHLQIEIDLPAALAHLANVPAHGRKGPRYRLAATRFAYRGAEWLAQVAARRACAYEITLDQTRRRVYLDASFTRVPPPVVPDLRTLLQDEEMRICAVDLNADHVAARVLDRAGNAVGPGADFPLDLENQPASTRDGHLRGTLSQVLRWATGRGCRAFVCENLGFEDMRACGRECYGRAKRFRATVCGMPTAQFRQRLVAMATRVGVPVIGVPSAWSSVWGAAYWQRSLCSTRHQAAAVVLGRRALGYSARRRGGKSALHQRMEAASLEAGAGNHPPGQEETRAHERSRASPRRPGGPGRGGRPVPAQGRRRGSRSVRTVGTGPSAYS